MLSPNTSTALNTNLAHFFMNIELLHSYYEGCQKMCTLVFTPWMKIQNCMAEACVFSLPCYTTATTWGGLSLTCASSKMCEDSQSHLF